MKKAILLLVAIISLMGFINAQDSYWKNYTTKDNINALVEEGNNIWIGTSTGLVKLDKTTGSSTIYKTSNSELPNNVVNSIAIDQNGIKWIGTGDYGSGGGLTKFDGINWTTYNSNNSGLADNRILTIGIDQNGSKWIGTHNGLSVYNEDGFTVSVDEKSITEINVKIYPNPANDRIHVVSNEGATMNEVNIYNQTGQKVLHDSNPTNPLDISKLGKGIYFVEVISNKTRSMQKVIVQ